MLNHKYYKKGMCPTLLFYIKHTCLKHLMKKNNVYGPYNIQKLYISWFIFLLAAVSYECWFPYGGVPAGKMGPQESGDSNHVCGKDLGTTGHTGKADKEVQVKFRAGVNVYDSYKYICIFLMVFFQ